jgi:PAS domain-containing protein
VPLLRFYLTVWRWAICSALVIDTQGEIVTSIGDLTTPAQSAELVRRAPLNYKNAGGTESVGELLVTSHTGSIWGELATHIAQRLLVLLVLIAILYVATKVVTRQLIGEPLQRLQHSIDRNMAEDGHEPVPWESDDELGRVVHAYNALQAMQSASEAALRSAHAELKELNEDLERRVDARTQQVEEQSALIHSVLAHVSQSVAAVDEDANLIAWNANFERTFYFMTELLHVGCPIRDIVARASSHAGYGADGLAALTDNRVTALTSGEPSFSELELVDSDGVSRSFEAASQPMSGGGFVITYSDVTERKTTAMELTRARDVAEAATVAKGEFLATMSHEIRTPMNGVLGMVDLLARTDLDAEQSSMRDSGYSLLTIINDILDFSKIEAGKLALESVSMSVREAVEGSAATLAFSQVSSETTRKLTRV